MAPHKAGPYLIEGLKSFVTQREQLKLVDKSKFENYIPRYVWIS
jgi:hypothetical protein